tara:strand:- start:942 stop:1766 length:825 start_codon:yes stop_codon:yes gene_type:complete
MRDYPKAANFALTILELDVIYIETDYVGDVYNMEHPRVLWNNVARRSTATASTSAAGYDATNAATATEGEEWKPTAMPANWDLTFDTFETINAIGIETHNLGTSGATVTLQDWDGGAWVDIMAATPTDDEPISFLFAARSIDRIRFLFSGSTAPSVSVIMVCLAIEIPRQVYMGAITPIDMALKTTYAVNDSTTGRFLGRSVLFEKNENEFTIRHLTERYMREDLFPFIKDSRMYPFFLLERPYSRPTALSYRITRGDITPQRMGIKDFMQVTL